MPSLRSRYCDYDDDNCRKTNNKRINISHAVFISQLVLNYEQELYSTGNQDLCFYNFQCARPVSTFLVEKTDVRVSVCQKKCNIVDAS